MIASVCVFTGSSLGADPAYADAARRLGAEIATRGWTLVYGGATVGLMGCVADAALERGGRVIGVLPRALAELEIAHPGLTELHLVEGMHARKAALTAAADAFIAMPGGLGTLEEIFEAWTWTQLGIHQKPLGFLNVAGYYDGLFSFLDRSVKAGLVKGAHRDLALVESDPGLLLEALGTMEINLEPKL